MSQEYILSQAYGYSFTLVLGFVFAVMMILITGLLKRYAGETQDSERFSTASRSVKTGLISSAVVSSWAWPATFLLSGNWSYTYGVAGVYWYAIIGSVQIVCFACLAVEIKLVAPGAHTVAEIVRARFGKSGHIVYLCYCLAVNIIVSATLLLGGAQGFSVSTGMHVVAGCMLLPIGVTFYTVFGGIKATFISDWIHTVIIYIIILCTMFSAYTTSEHIGSPSKMYDLLVKAGELYPSTGEKGSYLTMHNAAIIKTAWSALIGGFVTVFGDPSYGQKAISASAEGVFRGYLFGGLSWFIIPWALGSSAGLTTRALLNNPAIFSYPNPLTAGQAAAGMPLFYGMAALFGKSGAAAALVMLFMSVTSAMSAELVAFSSICTYDLYREYYNKEASGKKLVWVSHCCVVIFAIVMGSFATWFNYVGVNVGWIISFKGIILAPSVPVLAMTVFWKRMTKLGLILGAPLGTLTGLGVWVGCAFHYSKGDLNVHTLVAPDATLTANFAALFSGPIYAFLFSLLNREKSEDAIIFNEFSPGDDATAEEIAAMEIDFHSKEFNRLKKTVVLGRWIAVSYFLVFMIVLPMPIYGSKYICSKGLYTAWIVIIFVWLILVAAYIVFYPIYESWSSILHISRQIITGKSTHTCHIMGAIPEAVASGSSEGAEPHKEIS